jgi:hypothetical protein
MTLSSAVNGSRLAALAALLATLTLAGIGSWRLAAREAAADGPAAPAKGDSMTPYPEAAMLEDVPPGGPGVNSYARGLETVLNYVGTSADADTITGDSGIAFITMSEEGGPLVEGAVDVGWWPMASWGLEMRLDFLAQTVGRQIRLLPADAAAYRSDPVANYRDHFESEVRASIAARKPVLVVHDACFVVYGYDEKEPPLLGNWAAEDEPQTIRIERWPWSLILLGEATERLDRKAADLAALRHAVALAKDELDVKLPAYWAEWEPVTARYTGQKSYALWATMLRDTEHLGQARWHSNMVFHLRLNRGSAVRYLRAMANRHPEKVAAHLLAAADLYEQVLALLKTADTSQAAMMSEEGREKLAKLSESMAQVEARAVQEIEKALAAAGA